jgi:hypothetical protein
VKLWLAEDEGWARKSVAVVRAEDEAGARRLLEAGPERHRWAGCKLRELALGGAPEVLLEDHHEWDAGEDT